jgi:HD-GYP domain-containing protein (c-di-GMP phosphodiesterase class II)
MRDAKLIIGKEILVAGKRVVSNFVSFLPSSVAEMMELRTLAEYAQFDAASNRFRDELDILDMDNLRWYLSLDQRYLAVRNPNGFEFNLETPENDALEFIPEFDSIHSLFAYVRNQIASDYKLSSQIQADDSTTDHLIKRFDRAGFNGISMTKALTVVSEAHFEENLEKTDIETLIFAYYYQTLSRFDSYSKDQIRQEILSRINSNNLVGSSNFGYVYREDFLTIDELDSRRHRAVRLMNDFLTLFPSENHHICKQSVGGLHINMSWNCTTQLEARDYLAKLSDDQLIELTWVYFGYFGYEFGTNGKFILSSLTERLYPYIPERDYDWRENFDQYQVADLEQMLLRQLEQRPQAIAELVHENQGDRAGEDYINHPRRVAQNAQFFGKFSEVEYSNEEVEIARQAAWLHDVLEDSGYNEYPRVTSKELIDWGVSEEVVQVVEILTKNHAPTDHPADDPYYQAIKRNKIARLVKISDLTDNCNEERTEVLAQLGVHNKVEYYYSAIEFLELTRCERDLFSVRIQLPKETDNITWRREEITNSGYVSMPNYQDAPFVYYTELSNDGSNFGYYRYPQDKEVNTLPSAEIWRDGLWTSEGAEYLDKFILFGTGEFTWVPMMWATAKFPKGSIED